MARYDTDILPPTTAAFKINPVILRFCVPIASTSDCSESNVGNTRAFELKAVGNVNVV